MTQTLTLADFLLARIAEDEAEAEERSRPLADFYVPARPGKIVYRSANTRALAECAAKRQIVERLGLYASTSPLDSYTGHDESLVDVLRILALPYADHRDYRDEWRP